MDKNTYARLVRHAAELVGGPKALAFARIVDIIVAKQPERIPR